MATKDEQGNQLLSEEDFDHIRKMSREQRKSLPPEVQEAFKNTSGWHFGQRQKLHVDSIRIGGRTMAEVLALIREQKDQKE